MTVVSFGLTNLKRNNIKLGKHDDLKKAVFKCFMITRSNKILLNGLVLQEKANDLAKALPMDDFKASIVWLDRWKSENNVTFKAVSSKGKLCSPEITKKLSHLPTIQIQIDKHFQH